MDNESVVSSRSPIENLNLEDLPEFSVIFDKFDMFREVLAPELNLALSFFYLEHLLRVSTDLSDSESALNKLPEPLKSKFKKLFDSRLHVLQGSIHALDTIIKKSDLNGISFELVNFNYNWTGKKLNQQRSDYGKKPRLPVCFTFMFKSKLYLLYTVNMTYIDGFDPFTGSTKIPMVTQGMIKGMSKDFYTKASVSIEVQTDSPGKKNMDSMQSPRGSVRSVLRSEARSKSPALKESPRDFSPRIIEEMKMNNESFHQENENIEEDEEEEEEEEEVEDSESLTFEKDVNKQLPGERTWEKYQKRAVEKQKERDQCAPGDCLIV